MIATLCGGVGAARLLRGLVAVVPPAEVTAVVNVGDDTELHGLHVSPDLDTVTYRLAGLSDEAQGWGLAGESWTVMEALERLGGETWFRLGDRDLATHLYRTARLAAGAPLSTVTAELTAALGVATTVRPVTDDRLRTRLTLADGEEVGFQDYFVRRRHAVAVGSVAYEGAAAARPAPGVLEALAAAEAVVLCPSNPVLSIGPLLAVPGVAEAVAARRDQVVAVSPIVAGRALKGPADRLMAELGLEPSVVGVARAWAPFAATVVVDGADADAAAAVEACGVRCVVTATVMDSPGAAAALAGVVLEAAGG